MTLQSRSGIEKSSFGRWLRTSPELDSRAWGLSIIDVDWCIHQFKTRKQHGLSREIQNMMFLEEKTFEADTRDHFAQRDTLSVGAQVLMHGAPKGQPRRYKVRGSQGQDVTLRYFGWHLLRFSQSGPMDSEWIEWDRKRITLTQLIQVLRFEISPFTLRDRTERSHHGGSRQPVFDLMKN